MKCFYHNDMDGRAAGAVIAMYTKNYNKEDYFEVDYNKDLVSIIQDFETDETVYFVDYSFKDLTVLNLTMEKDLNVIWIDHHTSSMKLQEEYPDLGYIQGIRQEGISGAALAYMYLHKKEFNEIPGYLQLVSDYDCWKYEFPDTTCFKIGLESYPYDALDQIWKDLDYTDGGAGQSGTTSLMEVVLKGETIKSYIDADNASYKKSYAYETEIDGHKAMAVNRKTNSWIFGEDYYNYPLVCVWAFNGRNFSYSLFSSDKTVDCSEIAKQYGGGGHRGAAGFTSDELLFKQI